VPLLEQQQRDDQGKPLDDAELDGLGLGGRIGDPQAPGQFSAHHDRRGPGGGGAGNPPVRTLRPPDRHPGHRVPPAGRLPGLECRPGRARPARRRGRRRVVALGGRAGQHAAVGVLHRDRRAQRRRERGDQFGQFHLVQHQLHQLVVLPLGPLQHGPAAAHLLVGHGQLADDLLLLGPQPRRLQGHRGLPGQQLDQLQLGPAELPRGDRVGDDDPGQGAGSAQRRDQQGPVALGGRQAPQPAVGAGLADVGDDDRAALAVGAGGRGVEVGTWRPDTQPQDRR
jgi:hypothetical protein